MVKSVIPFACRRRKDEHENAHDLRTPCSVLFYSVGVIRRARSFETRKTHFTATQLGTRFIQK